MSEMIFFIKDSFSSFYFTNGFGFDNIQHYWHNVLCRGESFGRTHFLRFNDFGKRGRFKRDLEEGLTTIKEVEWMGVVWQ